VETAGPNDQTDFGDSVGLLEKRLMTMESFDGGRATIQQVRLFLASPQNAVSIRFDAAAQLYLPTTFETSPSTVGVKATGGAAFFTL
jgi:hypothetical protein